MNDEGWGGLQALLLKAKFWIVRPQISFNGISGLNTVLSGVYFETLWDDDGGALIKGASVLFRGISVGELRNLWRDEAGSGVLINAFVQSPYDAQLTRSTVFWDTSGVKLNLRSLSWLIQGGVELNTILSGG